MSFRIARHLIDEVRERADIVEVVQRHVTLSRRGNSFVGLCPFHEEKTPSFHVVPAKNLFHCFGCQSSGDVFRFLMQIEGLSFVEAVKELAGPVGVTIEDRELTVEERRSLRRRATSYDVLEAAAQFYQTTLWTRPEGAPARAYLEQRGLGRQIAETARLGYAPGGWTPLLDHLHQQRVPVELVEEVGLARSKEGRNSRYDAFRERLMFPIRDVRGRVIGFGGRLLQGDGPKYINTTETPVYDKSKVLYGLHMARQSIQQRARVLLVEGYMDVLALHQAGYTEAMATCGTALTPGHLEVLRPLTSEVVALFDADDAGARAAERSLPLFVQNRIQSWRMDLPGAKDPDEFLQKFGTEAFEKQIAARQPLLEWLVQRRMENSGAHASQRAEVVEELLPLLAQLPPAAISGLAAKLRINEQALLDMLTNVPGRPEDAPPPPLRSGWRPNREMVHFFWLLVHRYDQVADIVSQADPALVGDNEEVRAAMARLITGESPAAVLAEVRDEGVARTLAAVVAKEELHSVAQAAQAMCDILEGLSRPWRDGALARLTHDIENASRTGDHDALREAVGRRAVLVRLSSEMDSALSSGNIPEFLSCLSRQSDGYSPQNSN